MDVELPTRCFISHAYSDAPAREALIKRLPRHVEPVVFPPITVRPEQFVSNRLIEAMLSCDGLIYLTGGASDRSFWVAFERDYALRAGKKVFSVDLQTLKVSEHTGSALDLAIFPSYHRQDLPRVQKAADFLKRERFFDLWEDRLISPGVNWQQEISSALDDRLKRGYMVAFWSRAAQASRFMGEELKRAADQISEFNDRVLFALLEDVPLPEHWNSYMDPAVQLYEDADRAATHRLDDLMVRLYWLIYRKTRHSDPR